MRSEWGRPPVDFCSAEGFDRPLAPRPGAAIPFPRHLPCSPAASSPENRGPSIPTLTQHMATHKPGTPLRATASGQHQDCSEWRLNPLSAAPRWYSSAPSLIIAPAPAASPQGSGFQPSCHLGVSTIRNEPTGARGEPAASPPLMPLYHIPLPASVKLEIRSPSCGLRAFTSH